MAPKRILSSKVPCSTTAQIGPDASEPCTFLDVAETVLTTEKHTYEKHTYQQQLMEMRS
jgi:hypothetical protein